MPHSKAFFVNKQTKELEVVKTNPREYWRKGGEYEGMADTIIDVFGYDHIEVAKQLYDALVVAGLGDKYFHISIEVK